MITAQDKQTIDQEKLRDMQIVIPAAKSAQEYAMWAMQEIMKGNYSEAMRLVCQHTRVWGITQGIISELMAIDEMQKKYLKHNKTIFGKKQSEEVIAQKVMTIKSIFLAKLLREIFVDGTNFTEVKYGEEY